MSRGVFALLGACLIGLSNPALGHAASTAYLHLGEPQEDQVPLRWTVPLRDLDALLDLDADGDGRLRWAEVAARRADIEAVLEDGVRISVLDGAACSLHPGPLRFAPLESGGHAVLQARVSCPQSPEPLRLEYRFLERYDASHRVLLTTPERVSPTPLSPAQSLILHSGQSANGVMVGRSSPPSGFTSLLGAGFAHILRGPDHLLFLVALLLPSVLVRRADRWVARPSLRRALAEVAWIVTAFTLAHSISLAMATFHLVTVPARVIEPLIAITVLAAALNNLKPIVTTRLAACAFAFGLIHGFGFAEVLAPLDLPMGALAQALAGFNLGVEAGQLVVVAPVFAVLATARRWPGYPRWALAAGSGALSLVACVWIVERVFDVPLFARALAGT